MIRKRRLAGLIDGSGIFVLSAGFAALRLDTWPAWAAAILVYTFLSLGMLRATGATPGLYLTSLRLSGTGCLPCWEARRLGPVFAIALAGWGLEQIASWAGYLALAALLWLINHRVERLSAGDLPYDKATGFTVTPR